jgi:CBS-domain-containing membrane protein
MMKARDVMAFPVITVKPNSSIEEVAKTFVRHRISGAPVVDDAGKLIGIISEGDLMYRSELGTERPHPYWYLEYAGKEHLAAEYVKARARKTADLMTRKVITASPDSSLNDIAALLENNSIKRVPIVENGKLVGIVSRANLIQALTSAPARLDITPSDTTLRLKILRHLAEQLWADASRLNVIVHDGLVELWGLVDSDLEKQAVRVAAESMGGVRVVVDHLIVESREAVRKAPKRDITTR